MADTEHEIGYSQLGLGSVLKQNQLAVPPNQRDYAWEKKEVTTLFQDFSRSIDAGESSYFLGTIVTIPRANGILEVVDGQQRLSTTAILLSAIRDYLRVADPVLSESVDTEFLTGINRTIRERVPRLRLNLDDNDFFRARLTRATPVPLPTKSSHKLLDEAFDLAAKHVKSIVAGLDPKDHGDSLNRWVDFIESKALVILLRVPNAANAYRMFETLNDRGKRTSQSDLVKNYLFGRAGDRIGEVQQKWALMRGALESMDDEDTTITFLRNALTVIRGFVREADVYEAVQKYAKAEQPVVSFTNQLENLSSTFVAIHNMEHERWNQYSDSARRAIEVLNLFDIKPMRPLILAISEKFTPADAGKAFILCVSASVRLMISNRTRTGSVEEGLALIAHNIFTDKILTLKDFAAAIKPLVPTDGQFKIIFQTATVSNRKLARYYLRSLELAAKNENEPWHIPNNDKSIINLEHVLPEKPGLEWPEFTDDEVKLYKSRIGNLVLLRASENSQIGSINFNEKRKIYAGCPYELTHQISELITWNTNEITERQKVLADLAVTAWPI